jgi:hypothetical protein
VIYLANVIQTVTSDTGVAIGVVVSLVGAAVGCTWWLGKRLNKIESNFISLGSRLEQIEKRELDNYTLAQAEVHALRFAIANPSVSVPDPRDPSKIINAGHK